MSVRIDLKDVAAVLLVDGWHDVYSGSFAVGSFEFVDGDDVLVGGGHAAVEYSTGFQFVDERSWPDQTVITGPLTSILAIRQHSSAA